MCLREVYTGTLYNNQYNAVNCITAMYGPWIPSQVFHLINAQDPPIQAAIQYHTIPYHTIPHHTIQYHTGCYTLPHHTITYRLPYDTIQYHRVQYHTRCPTILLSTYTGHKGSDLLSTVLQCAHSLLFVVHCLTMCTFSTIYSIQFLVYGVLK